MALDKAAMLAIASNVFGTWPVLLAALIGGLVLAATLGLWGYYGSTVFFEMVRTGWIACF